MEEYQKSLATYFITDSTTTVSAAYYTVPCFNADMPLMTCYLQALPENPAKCLRANWIWDSLKQKHQLPIENYLVS